MPNFHFRLIKLNIVEDLTEMIMTQNSQISRLQQPLSFYPSRLRQGQGDAVFINIQLSQTCYFGWDSVEKYGEFLYSYNANNAVSSITHSNVTGSQIVKHSYTYDETNNIVEYLNSIDGQTSYDYDFLGQLISADHANQTDESYVYDSNGNRITANGDTYTTGDNNELTSDGTWTYTYDAEGNRISKTNATNRELYTWDHRNRLTTVTKQTYDTTTATWTTVQIVEYTYDYNNIWIRKTVDTNGDGTADSKSIFIPEAYQTAVQLDDTDLTDSAGPTVTHHYLWTPNTQDKLLADTTPTEVLWSLTDHLGTIRDILGATTTHLIYDSFGNLISGTNPLLFGYTGKAFDTDTQLQNNINRWYDALIGRWLSTDPIGFEGNDTNLYRYVKNQTTSSLDFNGNKLVNTGVKRCVAYWKDNWLFDHIPMHWFYKIGDIGFGKFEHSNCLVGAGEIHFDDNVAYPERNENNTPSGEFYSICYDVLIEEDCYRVSCIRNAIYQFAMLPSSCYFVGVNDCRTWTIAAMKYAKQNCRHMKKLTFQTFCKCTIEYNLEFTIKLED